MPATPVAPTVLPSGRQYDITAGPYAATVTEAGATLRTLSCGDAPLLDGFAAADICDGAHGQLLAPWPNRVDGGTYSFEGDARQLDLTEPSAGNAIHGLVRWDAWTLNSLADNAVSLTHRLLPRPGYPHVLDLRLSYGLDAETGLSVRLAVTNAGQRPAPWGTGQHPYVVPGRHGSVSGCTLRLPAAAYLETDDRGIPVADHAVDGSSLDFNAGAEVGAAPLDQAFGDLRRDPDGLVRVGLADPEGGAVTLWCDEAYRWVQVFTGHTLAPERRFAALAMEPMSCPPNAFVTGRDLVRLEPGESWAGAWGLSHER